jgi:methyl-accepting chemotaxis protein
MKLSVRAKVFAGFVRGGARPGRGRRRRVLRAERGDRGSAGRRTGQGFAVVAEEVRKLAEESQQAAASIASLFGEIQSETDRTVGVVEASASKADESGATVERAREAFLQISTSVDGIRTRVAEIVEATAEVAAVAEQSAASTEQVSASTEQTSASAQEIAASAQELATTAEELARLVADFKVTA